MAVTPIANLTFINQNSQMGSVQHSNAQVKLDFQSMINLQTAQDEQEKIQEVRPTEETLETKDEREGNGKQEREEQEQKKAKNAESKDEIQTNADGTISHLDISV